MLRSGSLRSRLSIKIGLIAIIAAALGPALAAQKMPVPDSAVERGLRDYLSKCDKANAVIKSELAPTYGFSDEDILGYPHKFFRDCYYYWEGSYGQIVRETVSIYFRKIDEDNWSMTSYNYNKGEQTIVQNPTKPLPATPSQPAKDQLSEAVKNYIPERYSLYEVISVNKLELGEPKFDWYGIDYNYGGYQYKGKVTVTWKKKGSKGIGLSGLMSSGKETRQFNCSFNMLYGIADEKWHAEFAFLNEIND
jgi:hypothetical protein